MNYRSAHSPRWANEEKTLIELFVDFEGIGEVPFAAHPDDGEAHGREIFARAAAGEFGTVADFLPLPRTQEEIERECTRELEAYYDARAKERRYDNRHTCLVRAGYTGPFQAEGVAFAQWMDTCNALYYQVIADVRADARPMPAFEELIALFPPLKWPA